MKVIQIEKFVNNLKPLSNTQVDSIDQFLTFVKLNNYEINEKILLAINNVIMDGEDLNNYDVTPTLLNNFEFMELFNKVLGGIIVKMLKKQVVDDEIFIQKIHPNEPVAEKFRRAIFNHYDFSIKRIIFPDYDENPFPTKKW